MPGIDEGETVWRVRQSDPNKYEKFRVKDVGSGVKLVLGKVKGKDKWEVQSVMLSKERFKDKTQVRKWIKKHKFEIKGMSERFAMEAQIEDQNETEGWKYWLMQYYATPKFVPSGKGVKVVKA